MAFKAQEKNEPIVLQAVNQSPELKCGKNELIK